MLCKAAYVRPNPRASDAGAGAWVWHDGSSLDIADRQADAPVPPLIFYWEPPPGTTCFYNVRELKTQHAKQFALAGSPGAIYAGELERLRAALRWPADAPPDSRFCQDGFQIILPTFFHTLTELSRRG